MGEQKNSDNEMTMIKNISNNRKEDEKLDIKSIVDNFIKNWWIFLASIVIAIVIAFIINKVTEPIFDVSASLVINEEANSLSEASAQLMDDIGFLSSNKNFYNELSVLKSTLIIQSALDRLDFRISYFQKKPFGQREIYKSSPFVVLLNKEHPQPIGCKISIKILDNKTYKIKIDAKEILIYSFVSKQVTQELSHYDTKVEASFGEYTGNNFFDFKIILNDEQSIEELVGQEYFFIINTDHDLIRHFKKSIQITPPDIESTVADITIRTSTPLKTIDFLNSLTKSYLNKDFEEKQRISEKTIEYIDLQLNKISESLNVAESDLEQFRSEKKVLDVNMQSQQFFTELNELRNEKARLVVNLKYVDYIQNYFKNNNQFSDLISPSAMGFEDPTLSSLIEELIQLNVEKESLIDNNQEKSPYLQRINIRIDNLRNMISENISYIKRTTNIALEDANSRIRQLNEEIQKMPETERELLGIERVFNINNNIYTYLLEKKSEAEIAKASYQPDIEIVNPAEIIDGEPVKPRKEVNYLLAIIAGFLLPTGVLRLKDLLGNTFSSAEEIKASTTCPVIGEIYHNPNNNENVVDSFPDSHIAESFRKVNINLKYLLNGDAANKTIALTSTISGEGKSFIALNFASILAQNNFRTVLAGFDIRKPREYSISTKQTNLGISDFLSNQASLEDIIQKTKNQYLDIIGAGKTPPNPAELLASKKTNELINELRENYDYVIIDTPPVGVVIDGFTLMDKTDLNIYISRVKYTPKKEFESLMTELINKDIINGLIINDVFADRKTKYGYNYYKNKSKKASWLRKN